MSGWQGVQAQVSQEQVSAVAEAAARELAGLPLAVLRNRRELGQRADAAVRTALRPFPVQVSPVQLQAMTLAPAHTAGAVQVSPRWSPRWAAWASWMA